MTATEEMKSSVIFQLQNEHLKFSHMYADIYILRIGSNNSAEILGYIDGK